MSGPRPTLPAESQADPALRRCRFPKRRRIASGDDFTAIIGKGSFAADDTLIVNALPTSSGRQRKPAAAADEVANAPPARHDGPAEGRLGVTIPRKTGNAVVRNRWKRLIREAYRLQQHELPAGFDFIVRPRRGAVAEFTRVHRSLRRLAVRAAATPPGTGPGPKPGSKSKSTPTPTPKPKPTPKRPAKHG